MGSKCVRKSLKAFYRLYGIKQHFSSHRSISQALPLNEHFWMISCFCVEILSRSSMGRELITKRIFSLALVTMATSSVIPWKEKCICGIITSWNYTSNPMACSKSSFDSKGAAPLTSSTPWIADPKTSLMRRERCWASLTPALCIAASKASS